MTEAKKNRMIWGALLLVGALGSASLRNNPALGISPLAIGVIDGLIFACILTAVRVSDWKAAVVIALVTPVYLFAQRFLEGFLIPVDMAVNLTLVIGMQLALKKGAGYWVNAALLALPAFAVLLIAETGAIWIVKDENLLRSLIIAWNADVYVGLSILGAALICAPHTKTEAR